MAKILVVSDSHQDNAILQTLVDEYQDKVDLMIHTGDSELEENDPLVQKFALVTGNMDYGTNFPVSVELTAGPDKIFVTHGHLANVNFELNTIMLQGKQADADMIFYGHTHQLYVTVEDGILLLNPGSISFPRGQYAKLGGTFAIVENSPERFTVQYYTRDLKPVKELTFSFKR